MKDWQSYPLDRAKHIYIKVHRYGPQQLRYYQGELRTYPFPAPRGYGTRGTLVGIYTMETHLEWIADDLVSLTKRVSDREAVTID